MSKRKSQVIDPHQAREAAKYDNPIPSREYITEVLEQAQGPMTHEALCETLGMETDDQIEALRRRLIAMSRDGQLISNRRQGFGVIDKMDLVRGRVQGHKDGFGFVIPAEGGDDLFLSYRQMRKVFDGDEVLARRTGTDFKGRSEGAIVQVLSHNTNQVVGRYFVEPGVNFVRPDNPRLSHDVVVAPEDVGAATKGQFVVVEVTQQPGRNNPPAGRILEVLGDHMAPGMEIDVAIRSHSIPHLWPSDVQAEANALPPQVNDTDKVDRVDLRQLPFVTIDGEDARDFDDAVYCESKRAGGWRLYVAIADVSHYVPLGGALDREAQVRGNSVYFPDYVVPMLPEALSNGLCSLNPKVDRLSMVCEMTISGAGRISGYKFYEAVIHSHARLTYTQVGEALNSPTKEVGLGRKLLSKVGLGKAEPVPAGISNDLKAVLPHVRQLHSLYGALRAARDERGAIDFETTETRILFDADRKIDQIVPVVRNDAHKLIEECMLAANVCAARFLEKHELPALYRVHEGPKAEKLENLRTFLGELSLGMQGGEKPDPKDYQQLLESIRERSDAHLIQMVMLRSLSQAKYQPDNNGHFGLGYQAYAHFTSPIRRYPDLLVHRAIRHVVRSKIQSKHVVRVDSAGELPKQKIYPYDVADMLAMGEQSSLTERRADDATRDVMSWLKCEYLSDHVGEEFDGTVSAATGFGLFVELDNFYVEGLIHITNLPHDYYHFEQAHHRLVGERTRQVFRIGDKLRVRVARVNLDDRKVDLELVEIIDGGRQRKSNRSDGSGSVKGKTKKKTKVSPAAKMMAAEHEADRKRQGKKGKAADKNAPKKRRGKSGNTEKDRASFERSDGSRVKAGGGGQKSTKKSNASAKPAKSKPSKGKRVRKAKSDKK